MHRAIGEPVAKWVFEVLGPIVWVVLAVYFVQRFRRERVLSIPALVFIGGTSMWWQEWYGDWASYLLYNPKFSLMHWGTTQWTTPNKPWAVIPAYGWYMGMVFPLMLAIVARVRRARPSWGKLPTLLLVTIPIFYAWDLFVEGLAAVLGWWSYTDTVGPIINSSRGNFPLLYPILLFVAFGVVATWILDQRDDRGRLRHEVLLGVHRLRAGWRRELGRAGSIVAVMNVAYWAVLIGPLILLRDRFGDISHIVP